MKKTMRLLVSVIVLISFHANADEKIGTKIWDDNTYNSFTDLAKFKDHYYCTFRSAISHGGASHDVMGSIIVLRSSNAKDWKEVARFSEKGIDLRDPKLLATPDDIRVYAGDCQLRPNKSIQYAACAWTSTDGVKWSDRKPMAPGYIFWRPKMYKGKFYVPAYIRRPGYCAVDILVSDNGFDWLVQGTAVPPVKFEDETLWANETDLLFLENGKALLFARRNNVGKPSDKNAKMGGFRKGAVLIADASELTNWKVIDQSHIFHCPSALEHNGRIFLAGRGRVPLEDGRGTETCKLWEFVIGKGFTELESFKTKGDSSYPGIVAEGEELLISYYSTHQGRTAYYTEPGKSDIYLSRVKLSGRGQ